MKSSLFLAATGAAVAMASPIRGPLEKRVMETDWVYDYVTVTVTAGQEPKAKPTGAAFIELPSEPSSEPAPAPAVTTTYVPPPAPKVTEAPEPTTSEESQSPPASSTPSNDGGSSSLGDYEGSMLNQHNIHRTNHSAPALQWDDTLTQYAKNTANKCVFKHDMDQGNGGYGQNLAVYGQTDDNIASRRIEMGASAVTNGWYNGEMPNWHWYGESNPGSSNVDAWGHFTQLVWKDSTKVGCETVKCDAGTIYDMPSLLTVCNYDPPGNYGGEYGNNVLEPLGEDIETI